LILSKIENKYNNNRSPDDVEIQHKLNLKFFLQTTIILILLLTILRGWLYRGTVQVLPFYIENIFSLDAETAAVRSGIYVTLMYIAGSIGQLIGGGLTDKYGFKKPMLLFGILAFGALLFMMDNWFSFDFLGSDSGYSFNSILVGILIFGFAFFAGQPIVNALIAEITPENIRGSFYGFTFFTRFGLSAAALAFIALFAGQQMLIAFYLVMIFTFISIFIILAIDPNAMINGIGNGKK
jgi:MFS family permease